MLSSYQCSSDLILFLQSPLSNISPWGSWHQCQACTTLSLEHRLHTLKPHHWIFSGGCPHSVLSPLCWAEEPVWQKEALNAVAQARENILVWKQRQALQVRRAPSTIYRSFGASWGASRSRVPSALPWLPQSCPWAVWQLPLPALLLSAGRPGVSCLSSVGSSTSVSLVLLKGLDVLLAVPRCQFSYSLWYKWCRKSLKMCLGDVWALHAGAKASHHFGCKTYARVAGAGLKFPIFSLSNTFVSWVFCLFCDVGCGLLPASPGRFHIASSLFLHRHYNWWSFSHLLLVSFVSFP